MESLGAVLRISATLQSRSRPRGMLLLGRGKFVTNSILFLADADADADADVDADAGPDHGAHTKGMKKAPPDWQGLSRLAEGSFGCEPW